MCFDVFAWNVQQAKIMMIIVKIAHLSDHKSQTIGFDMLLLLNRTVCQIQNKLSCCKSQCP